MPSFSMFNFPKISSRDNQKLKFARNVRENREKEWIFIEGLRLSEEILKTSLQIKYVFVTLSFLQNQRSIELIENLFIKTHNIFQIDENIFSNLAETKNSQGIIVISQKPNSGQPIIQQNLSQKPFLLLLHQINNPSNLGAILRTAEAAGVDGIITTKGSADVFSPKTLRGSMGASFRLPFWVNAEFSEVLVWAHNLGIKSICADIRSNNNYLQIDWELSRILVFGSEGHGLTPNERDQINESLIIPMAQPVESLNVAVACGIILFEAKKYRN
ncbi:MAG: RNA methyltransferase [Pyrinomonadaceae bacterium]|nr:RNA methyltransferase [Pyrinomonadaceae bacterium]